MHKREVRHRTTGRQRTTRVFESKIYLGSTKIDRTREKGTNHRRKTSTVHERTERSQTGEIAILFFSQIQLNNDVLSLRFQV